MRAPLSGLLQSRVLIASLLCFMAANVSCAQGSDDDDVSYGLPPDNGVRQLRVPGADVALVEVYVAIRAAEAQKKYGVSGQGCTAAVLDTGINSAHKDFGNRIIAQRNFTLENRKRQEDASDGHGHGTHVAGIVAANGGAGVGLHTGIAPRARIVAIKVLDDKGRAEKNGLRDALEWVVAQRTALNICAVNLSLGDSSNLASITPGAADRVAVAIKTLRDSRVAVVAAAGNDYYRYETEGMARPAILPQTISVASTFDADVGAVTYLSGASATSSAVDRLTPFTQRLSDAKGGIWRTDVFAPGAKVRSSGINGPASESTSSGTSQAAPVVTGLVLLLQEYALRKTGALPTVDQLERWLRQGKQIVDGDDEADNVKHTKQTYIRVDAIQAVEAAEKELGT